MCQVWHRGVAQEEEQREVFGEEHGRHISPKELPERKRVDMDQRIIIKLKDGTVLGRPRMEEGEVHALALGVFIFISLGLMFFVNVIP